MHNPSSGQWPDSTRRRGVDPAACLAIVQHHRTQGVIVLWWMPLIPLQAAWQEAAAQNVSEKPRGLCARRHRGSDLPRSAEYKDCGERRTVTRLSRACLRSYRCLVRFSVDRGNLAVESGFLTPNQYLSDGGSLSEGRCVVVSSKGAALGLLAG